jgi:outer membrane assembly lipoprotein YfiO
MTVLTAVVLPALIASIASAQQPPPQEKKTFEYNGSGQWSQLQTPAASATTQQSGPVAELDRIERLLQSNRNKQAERAGIKWVLANKTHPQRDRGLFLVARALYQYGNRVRSYYYLDELMDEHPDGQYFYLALELQYRIADEYLDGYKRRFVGIPMFRATDEAVEMLYRIQNRSPGSQLAEKSLLRTANFYYNNKDYDFAADTYAAYLRTYPRSPQVARVRLRQAFAMYAQFRGPRFDATPLIDAREQLRACVAQSPKLAEEENIPSLLDQLDRNLARKLFVTGDFYRRTRQPEGAAYTFRYLAKAYPQTPEAARAERELEKLPPQAVAAVPEPAITPAYAATSSPKLDPPRMTPGAGREPTPAGARQPLNVTAPPTFR